MADKPRTLEQVCEKEDLHIELNGNIYCSVSKTRPVECRWSGKKKDHNKLYPCTCPIYSLEFDSDKKPAN